MQRRCATPKYVNELCVGFRHNYCNGIVQISVTWDHKHQQTSACECQCHEGAVPVAMAPRPPKGATVPNLDKAIAFAKKNGLKGKLLDDFIKGLEKQI